MKMKMILLLLLATCCMQCSYSQKNTPQQAMNNNLSGNGPVVVELFTSEGCSSCPAADALMPELTKQYKERLIVLSFHVDYWDRLGWKDAFSSSQWTARQNQYAAVSGSENVYTPQAVVNGTTSIVGSDRGGLTSLIDNAPTLPAVITLQATKKDAQHVTVSYHAMQKSGQAISLLLVQQHAGVEVKRGENGGRTLQHYDIVRSLKTTSTESGEIEFTIPDDVTAMDCHIVALIQEDRNMHIAGAATATLN